MLGRAAAGVQHGVLHLAVLTSQERVVAGRAVGPDPTARLGAEQGQHRGRHVDQPAGGRDRAPLGDAGPGEDERRPGLHHADRAVLADVAALVGPVVGGGVDGDEVGRHRRVEQLGELVVGEGVGVDLAGGVGRGPLVGQRREPVGGGVGQRVAPLDLVDDVPPAVPVDLAVEPAAALGRGRLVGAVAHRSQHHVDDVGHRRIEQRRLGDLDVGAVLVGSGGRRGGAVGHGGEGSGAPPAGAGVASGPTRRPGRPAWTPEWQARPPEWQARRVATMLEGPAHQPRRTHERR